MRISELCNNNILILLISTQKSENDVITTDMKSAGTDLLNYYYFRHTQSSPFFDKSTGPILPFVVLALCPVVLVKKINVKIKVKCPWFVFSVLKNVLRND